MMRTHELQFRLLPPEARHAALHRLALRGCDPESISEQTGIPAHEVRRQLSDAALEPFAGSIRRTPDVASRRAARTMTADSRI